MLGGRPNEIATVEVREEALKKIGRNVVNFQKMEAMLKFLNTLQGLSGSAKDLQKAAATAKRSKLRKPFGPLADEFLKSAYSSNAAAASGAADDVSVSFSFRIEADSVLAAERKKALRSVVRERNQLIHKWLASFDPNSHESCVTLGKALDDQHNRIRPEFEALSALVSATREHVQSLASVVSLSFDSGR
jgi:hypothetical protein